MSNWHDIKYYGFWDQPRTFYTLGGEQSFLFDCQFDEILDDYPTTYNVYQIHHADTSDLPALWSNMSNNTLHFLGTIKLPFSAFDQTRRKQIDLDILSHLILPESARGDA